MERYSRDAHLTGMYDVIFRNGQTPRHIMYMDAECNAPVVTICADQMSRTHLPNGAYYFHSESPYDLFLIPKIADSWHVLAMNADGGISAHLYASEARARRYHPDGVIVNLTEIYRQNVVRVPRETEPANV